MLRCLGFRVEGLVNFDLGCLCLLLLLLRVSGSRRVRVTALLGFLKLQSLRLHVPI